MDPSYISQISLWLFLFFVTMTNTTVNGQGIRSPDQWKPAFCFLCKHGFDIILVQETPWSDDMEIQVKREWEVDLFAAHGTNSARGVGVLINPHLGHHVRQVRRNNEGHILNICW